MFQPIHLNAVLSILNVIFQEDMFNVLSWGLVEHLTEKVLHHILIINKKYRYRKLDSWFLLIILTPCDSTKILYLICIHHMQ